MFDASPDFQTQSCRLILHDLEGIMPYILDSKQLKENVKRLHATHCTSEPSTDGEAEAGTTSGSGSQEADAGCERTELMSALQMEPCRTQSFDVLHTVV